MSELNENEKSESTPSQAENPVVLRSVSFDHVDDKGNIILTLASNGTSGAAEKLTLPLTTELEKGVTRARDIIEQARVAAQKPLQQTLPLAEIQVMVREGASFKEVASKYGIDVETVRHYAQSVEQEKRFAISQFLNVRLATDNGTRSTQRLIADQLQAAGVDMTSLRWNAWRKVHEPWQIQLSYKHSDILYRARWNWNLSDNHVDPLDPAAAQLVRPLTRDTDPDVIAEPSTPVSRVSGRTSRAGGQAGVSQASGQAASTSSTSHAQSAASSAKASAAGTQAGTQTDGQASGSTSSRNSQTSAPQASGSASSSSQASAHTTSDAAGIASARGDETRVSQPVAIETAVATAEVQEPSEEHISDAAALFPTTAEEEALSTASLQKAKKNAHKGRSAIPSWDDIIFGDQK
ncbi:MAG: septation protein SepH [Aeriscardovia aeriphila]|nr:septation protein SepH [Aeriscardovia aeriphila]